MIRLGVTRRQFDHLCGSAEDLAATVDDEMIVSGDEGEGD